MTPENESHSQLQVARLHVCSLSRSWMSQIDR